MEVKFCGQTLNPWTRNLATRGTPTRGIYFFIYLSTLSTTPTVAKLLTNMYSSSPWSKLALR